MNFCDVAGPPGVGKSTLCDPLWGPRDIPLSDIQPPPEWHDFCNEITRLLMLIDEHPTHVAAVRMNRRSMRKMAAVRTTAEVGSEKWQEPKRGPYIQTGFAQRGLGFGWRLEDMGLPVGEMFHFWRLMPVSIGVVFLECDRDVNMQRNRDREQVAETAHENRQHMVDLMAPGIQYAKDCLDERGIPTRSIRTDGDIEAARHCLLQFASQPPCDAAQAGSGREGPVLSPPVWW